MIPLRLARCFTLAAVAALLVMGRAAAAPPGFGCYSNVEEVGGLANWPAHCKLMARVGMNTFALFYRDETQLQEQIDIAIEQGMLEQSIPAMIISNAGPAVGKRLLPDWEAIVAADTHPPSGFAPGEYAIPAAVARAAKAQARHPDKWPELLAYNYDEPGHGEAAWDGQAEVGKVTAAFNRTGLRSATAVCYPHIRGLIPHLDILVVNLIIGGEFAIARCEMLAANKPWWVYEIHTHGMPEEAVRYNVGVQSWLLQVENRLTWSWTRLLGEQKDMAHPVASPALIGYALGRRDFDRLTLVEQRMTARREAFDWEGFPLEQFSVPESWRTWKPPVEWFDVVP